MITIDDSYIIHSDTLRGRKPKFKLEKNGKKYIYKFEPVNNEIWAELIAEQLGTQVGIRMAHYEYATCQDTKGVITDYFLKPHELIISSDNLKENAQAIFDENSIQFNLSENTIVNIVTAAIMYDDRVNPEALTQELMLRWCFYGLIMEGDKNATNIGFIKGTSALSLTPDYDNSSMAGLNKNIQNIIDAIRHGQSVYRYTDNFKTNLRISEEDSGYFLQDFANFVKKYPQQSKTCMEQINNINIEEAFDNVEAINDVQIPWDVKFWITKAVSSRLEDMNNIYANNKQDTDGKVK